MALTYAGIIGTKDRCVEGIIKGLIRIFDCWPTYLGPLMHSLVDLLGHSSQGGRQSQPTSDAGPGDDPFTLNPSEMFKSPKVLAVLEA